MRLYDRIVTAFVWVAAFCLACGVFLSITLLFRSLPPTDPVAIGLVTIERYSKLRDYLGAALFFLLVPPLTIWLEHFLGRTARALDPAAAMLFTLPYFFSPLFYLTTGKIGWILGLPIVLSLIAPRALAFARSRLWIRRMFRRELGPYHALLFSEGLAWILFRYLVTAKRIAHFPTLFLEVVFVALFLALFWGAALLVARLAEINFGRDAEETFRRITVAALPVVALPFLAILWVPLPHPRIATAIAIALCILLGAIVRKPLSPRAAWNLAAYALIPALIYAVSYGSTAHLSQWIDLFHRGEAVGPASDYLRGKIPYRDVFPLHGMLEDGQLDAWLMQLFGRSIDVAVARTAIVGAFLGTTIWFLGIAVFESIPLALLCVAMGSWTTAENNRTFFQVAAVALFWNAVRRGSRVSAVASGIFAGVALFFSFEIGLYTIAGALVASLLLWIAGRFVIPSVSEGPGWVRGAIMAPPAHPGPSLTLPRNSIFSNPQTTRDQYFANFYESCTLKKFLPLRRGAARRPPLGMTQVSLFFAIGTLIGTAPFAIYLAMHGALDDFFATSFIVIPRIIDAVWALPFPDLVSTFRRDLNLHTLADFVLWEKFHLVVSPLTIAIAAVYFIQRWLRRRVDVLDRALLVLAVFAAITQRSAFGRAEFRHQYFAAFLIGPMLVLLALLAARKLRDIWREGGEGTRAFVVALIVAAIPVIGVLFWIPDLVNSRIDGLTSYYARALKLHRESHAEEVYWRIHDVTREVSALTRANEPIFDFSNQPAFYFFASRPNPTRFYQIPILSPREFQAETIGDLERARPKVILRRSPELFDQFDGVTNDLRAQAVSAYIHDVYRFHKSVRGVELWTRRPNARPRGVAEYLRAIRMPEKKELVAGFPQRMVFPAVGSVHGAGGSYWQSDLTIHNPFRDPLRLELRYVSNEIGIDRALTLAPRQTLRWPDVVRTFFGAPGAVGTLWIEHRDGRAPVAVVKTADIAHGGRAAIETALTPRDSATAATQSAELAIIGIPAAAAAGRRVNVGVVNIGRIPATFRIGVRTRTGMTVGRETETGVPEDQVWIVNDVEHALGVQLDETMTVRVTVIAGTGVAFATVVEPSGDSEFIAAIPTQQQQP
ncbi:MAG TPA: hypothetical protein VNA69_01715 [Thermoanaerobaculia bacterium]|nr:hypothetical protein [Thermoanaerobaculia bacterium]